MHVPEQTNGTTSATAAATASWANTHNPGTGTGLSQKRDSISSLASIAITSPNNFTPIGVNFGDIGHVKVGFAGLHVLFNESLTDVMFHNSAIGKSGYQRSAIFSSDEVTSAMDAGAPELVGIKPLAVLLYNVEFLLSGVALI